MSDEKGGSDTDPPGVDRRRSSTGSLAPFVPTFPQATTSELGDVVELAMLPPDAPVILMLPSVTPYRLRTGGPVAPVAAVCFSLRDLAKALMPLMDEEARRWTRS